MKALNLLALTLIIISFPLAAMKHRRSPTPPAPSLPPLILSAIINDTKKPLAITPTHPEADSIFLPANKTTLLYGKIIMPEPTIPLSNESNTAFFIKSPREGYDNKFKLMITQIKEVNPLINSLGTIIIQLHAIHKQNSTKLQSTTINFPRAIHSEPLWISLVINKNKSSHKSYVWIH